MKRSLSTRPRHSRNLVLRPFRRRDADTLFEAASASLPELNKWLPWAVPHWQRSDAVAFLRDSTAAWNEGRAWDFAIRHQDDPDRHLGNVSVWFTSRQARVGEVGYWVRTDETRKGVGTEAVARILAVAFDELHLHRVVLRIAVGNTASDQIAAKLGFTKEGLLREEVLVNGVWLDHSLWGLLENEYRRERARYLAAGYA
jgi:ribosomal-protein-serine acetyltransferase